MFNKMICKLVAIALAFSLVACSSTSTSNNKEDTVDTILITLQDNTILVDGEAISTDPTSAVYVGENIIYYEDGKDKTYGEGDASDAHGKEEADLHTVVKITKSGNYTVSGELSHGQIWVDLGSEAKSDPNAVVTLTLKDVEITNTVAPALLVTNVYECANEEDPKIDIDTTGAGFNLILMGENTLNGSHVAKIYKEGTTSKLHKYDGTISSKRTMTIDGEGSLTVNADNEGISGNMHLVMNGGYVVINSKDDAINVNEDYVSVFEMNGGTLVCNSGLGSEGDGIDSNGWLVINDGVVVASANPNSMDSGLDADNGIMINGGTVVGSGNMYDTVENTSTQMFASLSFGTSRSGNDILLFVDSSNNPVVAVSSINKYSIMVFSSELIFAGDYTLYSVESVEGTLDGYVYTDIKSYEGAIQLGHLGNMQGNMGMRPNGGKFEGGQFDPSQFDMSQLPSGFDPSQSQGQFEGKFPQGGRPEGMPQDMGNFDPSQMPNNFDPSQMPGGFNGQTPQWNRPNMGNMPNMSLGEVSTVFTFSGIANIFSGIIEITE